MINPILSADTTAEIAANFTHNIVEDSVLCSDGSWSYVAIAKEKKCDHKRLIIGKVRVIDKVYHIQTVNGAIAHFKGWINGKMKGVATKYLSNYLAWFRESNANFDSCLRVDNSIMEQNQKKVDDWIILNSIKKINGRFRVQLMLPS